MPREHGLGAFLWLVASLSDAGNAPVIPSGARDLLRRSRNVASYGRRSQRPSLRSG